MTIGPAPMIRMLRISVRLGTAHPLDQRRASFGASLREAPQDEALFFMPPTSPLILRRREAPSRRTQGGIAAKASHFCPLLPSSRGTAGTNSGCPAGRGWLRGDAAPRTPASP